MLTTPYAARYRNDMWWKVYFWIIAFLFVSSILFYGSYPVWTLRDWIEVISTPLALIGLYSFVYKKQMLQRSFWFYFFWISVALVMFDALYFYSPYFPVHPYFLHTDMQELRAAFMPSLLLVLPLYYALYRLSYPEQKKKESRSKK